MLKVNRVQFLHHPQKSSESLEELQELQELKEHLNRAPVHSRARAARVRHFKCHAKALKGDERAPLSAFAREISFRSVHSCSRVQTQWGAEAPTHMGS